VRAFITERCHTECRVMVVGPLYRRLETELELLPQPGADGQQLARCAEQCITAFLHPVTGGVSGDGWPFGRWPHASELRTALQGLMGLAEVRQLRLRVEEGDEAEFRNAAHALVCAGRCTVRIAG
jgi:hypothetical protein